MSASRSEPRSVLLSNQCPSLRFAESEVVGLFRLLDAQGSFDAPCGELSVAFVSEKEISRLHSKFMGDPSVTDVITFPGDSEIDQAGEICVCPQVANTYAEKGDLPFAQELALYLIHGYLHLAGFDDIEEKDRSEMRKAEQLALSLIAEANAFPCFDFKDPTSTS